MSEVTLYTKRLLKSNQFLPHTGVPRSSEMCVQVTAANSSSLMHRPTEGS